MKLCKDCKWSRLARETPEPRPHEYRCAHPKLLEERALVTGDAAVDYLPYCAAMRLFNRIECWFEPRTCGRHGRFWEPKP